MSNPFRRRSATDLSVPAKFVAFLLLLGWAVVVLLPIYWLVVTSFKTPYDVDKGPFYIPFVDFQPTLDAWRYILVELGNDTLRPYVNTVIVGLASSANRAVHGLVHGLRPGPVHLSAEDRADRRRHRVDRVRLHRRGHRRARATRDRRGGGALRCCWPRRSAAGSSGRSPTATSRSGSSHSGSCRRSRSRSRCTCSSSRSGCSTASARSDHHLRGRQPADRRLAHARLLRHAAARARGVGRGRRRVDLSDRALDRAPDLPFRASSRRSSSS